MTAPIDRRAVVRRHDVVVTHPDRLEPLSVGNGNFAFTADVTGLQTFPGFHDFDTAVRAGGTAMPLGTQAQWGFHESANPNGWTLQDVMRSYRTEGRDVDYPVEYDLDTHPDDLDPVGKPGDYLWVNPQRIDLGTLGFEFRATPDAEPMRDIAELTGIHQVLDLWSGRIESSFSVFGERVEVVTTVAPDEDTVIVRVRSALLRSGAARVRLAFSYPVPSFSRSIDWDSPDRHHTVAAQDGRTVRFDRTLDATRYRADLLLDAEAVWTRESEHQHLVSTTGDELEIVLRFAPDAGSVTPVPPYDHLAVAASEHWERFWMSGAAIDLAGSADPRSDELERRVVLSQYLTAIQCAGDLPPQETGLTMNSWAGKFHLEMHWWHAAHFAMWGRPALLERSFRWYLDALPVAREIARSQGYAGARWPKHVGPEGRESPNDIGPLLIWQQPHPIHLAELLRMSSDGARVEREYAAIVGESAEFLASYLRRDAAGAVHVGPPVMPAQERYDPAITEDPVFETAYISWALRVAQEWRERAGLPREASWDDLVDAMASPAVVDGIYPAVRDQETVLTDHPSMLAALGVVPPVDVIDADTMLRTYDDVIERWVWPSAWGWDFPVLAMCAARMGEPQRAVDGLLLDAAKNRYLRNGHNFQTPDQLPLYLPGNGGLLAAVALMAGGTDGGGDAAGFPEGWTVAAEGFPARP